MAPRVSLLVLFAACALAASASSAAATDCSYECAYSTVITGRNQSAESLSRCLSACNVCIGESQSTGGCCNFFIPQFDSSGTFTSSTCQSTCGGDLPAWAIVAICLGTVIVLGIITCTTFVFVCRCMKYKVALAKAKAQAQQQLPTTAVPVPTPEQEPVLRAPTATAPPQATCMGIPANTLHGPYAPMPPKPYPAPNTVSYPEVKGSGEEEVKPPKAPPV